MKITYRNTFAAVLALILALSLLPTRSLAEESQITTKKEFKALLKTAKEPVEHRRVAEYYRQEASRLTTQSRYHEEMGRSYKTNPLPFEAKHPYGTIGLSHCGYWSRLDEQQAQKDLALAARHERMAKAAEQE